MVVNKVRQRILEEFPFEPTADQAKAIEVFSEFISNKNKRSIMIMRGSAGTGKTSLASAVVRALVRMNHNTVLLAPTGRAAKVFSQNSGLSAYTIHRKIYKQKSFTGGMGHFVLSENLFRKALFIVDEASMISNKKAQEAASFGSGKLLDDLISFVYNGHNCRMMLIGDKAQLPPVGEDESPGLMAEVLTNYEIEIFNCDLDEVLRQAKTSGILFNATLIRHMITHDEMTLMPKISFSSFADICMVRGKDIVEQLSSSYHEVGEDETIIVTRSNKWANRYNFGIRSMVFDREKEITSGDMIMVAKNNYYWINPDAEEGIQEESAPMEFIANGDRAKVKRIRNSSEAYGFHFADVWIEFPDYDNFELRATVITDSLQAEAPSLTMEQSSALYNAIMEDYKDIKSKPARLKKLRQDPHYNAIQIKYAYAITCHKAQGGQWSHVYIDQGWMTSEMYSNDYIHWLYTAFTRAKDKLFLVNWPKMQINMDDYIED